MQTFPVQRFNGHLGKPLPFLPPTKKKISIPTPLTMHATIENSVQNVRSPRASQALKDNKQKQETTLITTTTNPLSSSLNAGNLARLPRHHATLHRDHHMKNEAKVDHSHPSHTTPHLNRVTIDVPSLTSKLYFAIKCLK